ncbi:hypothetical protein MPSEU_001025000 [Mayamaea pseudoterrestris]|nr:hypothetical protein MPSEU_001025000 [Mayamaea pseudoterrestris]
MISMQKLACNVSSTAKLSVSFRRFTATTRVAASASNDSSESKHQSHFMLILGKPGGGKGTISEKILKDFPMFHHVSTGDLLRQHVRANTPLGKEAKEYMATGELVPDSLMIDLVMDDATPYLESGQSLLLDGFPRSLRQAQSLEKVAHIDLVINLDIPTQIIVDRIADRWIHPKSGRIYSYSYKAPKAHGKDDFTGEILVQRDDDKPEAVRARLAAYDKITAPLVDFYNAQGVVKTFQGTMSDKIYIDVKAWLQSKGF